MKLRDFNYQQKSQGQTYPWMALPDIYRGINSNVLREFHKNRTGVTLPNMSHKARVTLEPKLDTGKASKPQWARLLPARPEDPSLTPGTHTVEREN